MHVSRGPGLPEEQRCVLLDRPCRADARIQPASRTASDLGGMPLGLLGDREGPLLGAEGASGPVAAVRGFVDTAVTDPLLALPAFYGAGDGNRTRTISLGSC
jgi:hypothetical protein